MNNSAEVHQRWQNQTWNLLAAYHKLRPCCLFPAVAAAVPVVCEVAGALFEFICQCWVINNCWRLRQWSLIGRWKTICYVGCQRATPPPPLHCLHQADTPPPTWLSAGHMASLSNNPGDIQLFTQSLIIMYLYLNWILNEEIHFLSLLFKEYVCNQWNNQFLHRRNFQCILSLGKPSKKSFQVRKSA